MASALSVSSYHSPSFKIWIWSKRELIAHDRSSGGNNGFVIRVSSYFHLQTILRIQRRGRHFVRIVEVYDDSVKKISFASHLFPYAWASSVWFTKIVMIVPERKVQINEINNESPSLSEFGIFLWVIPEAKLGPIIAKNKKDASILWAKIYSWLSLSRGEILHNTLFFIGKKRGLERGKEILPTLLRWELKNRER